MECTIPTSNLVAFADKIGSIYLKPRGAIGFSFNNWNRVQGCGNGLNELDLATMKTGNELDDYLASLKMSSSFQWKDLFTVRHYNSYQRKINSYFGQSSLARAFKLPKIQLYAQWIEPTYAPNLYAEKLINQTSSKDKIMYKWLPNDPGIFWYVKRPRHRSVFRSNGIYRAKYLSSPAAQTAQAIKQMKVQRRIVIIPFQESPKVMQELRDVATSLFQPVATTFDAQMNYPRGRVIEYQMGSHIANIWNAQFSITFADWLRKYFATY
jgi:hypothetical protein